MRRAGIALRASSGGRANQPKPASGKTHTARAGKEGTSIGSARISHGDTKHACATHDTAPLRRIVGCAILRPSNRQRAMLVFSGRQAWADVQEDRLEHPAMFVSHRSSLQTGPRRPLRGVDAAWSAARQKRHATGVQTRCIDRDRSNVADGLSSRSRRKPCQYCRTQQTVRHRSGTTS